MPSTSSLCDRQAVIGIFWCDSKIPKFIPFETKLVLSIPFDYDTFSTA